VAYLTAGQLSLVPALPGSCQAGAPHHLLLLGLLPGGLHLPQPLLQPGRHADPLPAPARQRSWQEMGRRDNVGPWGGPGAALRGPGTAAASLMNALLMQSRLAPGAAGWVGGAPGVHEVSRVGSLGERCLQLSVVRLHAGGAACAACAGARCSCSGSGGGKCLPGVVRVWLLELGGAVEERQLLALGSGAGLRAMRARGVRPSVHRHRARGNGRAAAATRAAAGLPALAQPALQQQHQTNG